MTTLKGRPMSPGYAEGVAWHWVSPPSHDWSRADIAPAEVIAELRRFREALSATIAELQLLRDRTSAEIGADQAGIFGVQIAILGDATFVTEVQDRIAGNQRSAEHALISFVEDWVEGSAGVTDEHRREQALDMRDLAQRLMWHLSGRSGGQPAPPPEQSILVTGELSPSNVMQLDRSRIVAAVTEWGGPTGHASILLRSLGIPAVTGVTGIRDRIRGGQNLLVNGELGTVIVEPNDEEAAFFRKQRARHQQFIESLNDDEAQPCTTLDGVRISLCANISRSADVADAVAHHLEGVELLRAELLFAADEPPSLLDQYEAYSGAGKTLGGRPLVVRTFDLGGDKIPRFLEPWAQANPNLSLRGLGFALRQEHLLRTQVLAILDAAQRHDIRVLFPMVTRSIVDTVHNPLIVLDEELRVLSANPAFLRTFNVDADEIMGARFYDLDNRQWDIPELCSVLKEVADHGQRLSDFEVRHEFPTLGPRIMLLNARRIEGTENLPHRVLVAIEDVTAREKAREELRALNVDLEQRVTDRTALADRRSDQLRRLAAELSRSEQRERERLARVLHDNLQQLLVAASFQLAAVRSRASDERARTAVDLMEDLLKQSLDASRALTVELSPTILYESGLDAALPWLARLMETRHGLKVQTEINATVPQDETGVAFLLFSAVRELLLNVAKHAGVKSARVQLDRLDGDQVRTIVSDEGKGFDPASLRGGDEATGLGLFGLQERLEHIGGHCVIDSAPGRGTRVTLTARVGRPRKCRPTVQVPAERREAPAVLPHPAERAGSKVRVLLADDHAIVRQGLKGILDAEPGIAVIAEAGDGQDALEQARLHRPDVIIMDVSMPGMNGIDATKAIMAELPDTKIIGLSMYAEADQAEAMQQAGAVGYLSKGGPSEQLIAAIRLYAPKPESRTKALLVEDSLPVARFLVDTLGAQDGENLDITHTETLAGAAALLDQQHFDVILLDLSLPDSAGMATIDRARDLAPGTPILVLTSADDEMIRENALRRGAAASFVKGNANAEAIITAIRDVTEGPGRRRGRVESEWSADTMRSRKRTWPCPTMGDT